MWWRIMSNSLAVSTVGTQDVFLLIFSISLWKNATSQFCNHPPKRTKTVLQIFCFSRLDGVGLREARWMDRLCVLQTILHKYHFSQLSFREVLNGSKLKIIFSDKYSYSVFPVKCKAICFNRSSTQRTDWHFLMKVDRSDKNKCLKGKPLHLHMEVNKGIPTGRAHILFKKQLLSCSQIKWQSKYKRSVSCDKSIIILS